MNTRILVADDETDVLEMLRLCLVLDGFDVITARDGNEAQRILSIEPIDAAIIDVMMPGVDGLSLLARLRANSATASLPVVILTAAVNCFDDRLTPYRTDRTHFLAKPADPADVVRIVDRMCREAEQGAPVVRGRLAG